ncbi:hypothetical protein CONLIGDRAFT_630097 [Coniochaeta ligniaria NRRL 30616]|uniref:Uncharacterized protein n=1 Tax=Coniochaeta ligniaria NRRL 30616 TaxID=1408157 RepID=A0A1J7IY47_9PEZI|nr:hypothetical protein CONLIGDRAFT_630097 [Coniochaeta ligniaria NRRL 30616]
MAEMSFLPRFLISRANPPTTPRSSVSSCHADWVVHPLVGILPSSIALPDQPLAQPTQSTASWTWMVKLSLLLLPGLHSRSKKCHGVHRS